jgi:hypothetical protein
MSFNSPFSGNVVQPTDVSYASYSIAADTQLQWPINREPNVNYAARIMQNTATVGSLKLIMPPANQASVGQDALIRNVGANTFTVVDYAGNTIISVAAGQAQYIYITTNATTAGTWGIIAFGTGTSSSDAATLAGAGLVAQSTTLNQSHPVSYIANNDTFVASDRAEMHVWTGGAGTVTLPLVSVVGDNWFVMVRNAGTGTLTVNTSGGQLLDSSASKLFQPGDSAFIVCTGTDYLTIGYGQSTSFSFSALSYAVTGGSYTLTASEAANTIQEITGTLSASVTIVYPPVVNLYVISNQTSAGGNSLTVKTATGTGVVVPPSSQVTVICDGVDFFNANTTQIGATAISLISGTAASPAINFIAQTNTGMFYTTNTVAFSVIGTQRLSVTVNGIVVNGTGTFTGGVSGGVF